MAIALYFAVERPFRRASGGLRVSNRTFVFASVALAAGLFLPSLNALMSTGWMWRYSPQVTTLLDTSPMQNVRRPAHDCFMGLHLTYEEIPPECYTIDRSSPRKSLMLYGDSSAEHLYFGIHQILGDEYDIYLWSGSNCPPLYTFKHPDFPYCEPNTDAFIEKILPKNQYDLVVISNNLRPPFVLDKYKKTETALSAAKAPFIVIGQSLYYDGTAKDLVIRHGKIDGLREFMKSHLGVPCNDDEYGEDEIVGRHRFFSMKKALCQDGLPVIVADGRLVQRDNFHLSEAGSLFIARLLKSWLDQKTPADIAALARP